MPRKCRIIAEAGVNHNGSLACALKMVDMAAECGADIVKFQTFKAENIVIPNAPKAEYQEERTGDDNNQFEMLRSLELSETDFAELFRYGHERGIDVISTPFDLPSVELLRGLGQTIWKIASGELTNLPLLRVIGGFNHEVILSTGMSELDEIKAAVRILVDAGLSESKLTILHCTTEYPAPFDEVNLGVLATIQREFPDSSVGYSDHTLGIDVPVAAVALGAAVIEKHYTLDKNMEGPDHKASLDPTELCNLVKAVRNVELALGDGKKSISKSELKNRPIVRKSIVASRDIKCGEMFTDENLTVKRPGFGISPMHWDSVIGSVAKKDFSKDSFIECDFF